MNTLRRALAIGTLAIFGLLAISSHAAQETPANAPAAPTAQEESAGGYAMGGMVGSVQDRMDRFAQELTDLRQGLQGLPQQLAEAKASLFNGEETATDLLGLLLLMFALGAVCEKLATLRLDPLRRRMEQQQESRWYVRLGYLVLGSLFSLVALLVFTLPALLVPVIAFDAGEPPRLLLVSLLAVVVTLRFVAVLARVILAPWARGIRPLPLECEQARCFYRWTLAFALVYALMVHGSEMLLALGLQRELVLAAVVVCGLLLTLFVVAVIWLERRAINQMFAEGLSEASSASPIRQMVAQSWPFLATAWILLLWGIWAFNRFIDNDLLAGKVSLAWWATLLFPALDRLVYALLSRIAALPVLQVGSFPQRAPRVVSIILNGFRVLLAAGALIALSEAWGMGSFDMMQSRGGQQVLGRLGDVLVILLLAYVVWEVVRTLIEQHMPETQEDADAAPEGEGGAGGATRTETLLPLLRSFILVVLVVVVVLTLLHSLGIEIGPLIAGAGVVGIAVGFGAQKLVQDVISGIFFLLDDAFRRGEYIETGGLRGTVEKISMRSMRLRHHLGAVQTIPYGEIATVKNLSRDWITMKLELRLPYDTDIEKVRKTIKKVGQEMLEDEEMGPSFILPLKSQGVMRVEESALIVRMKFTSKPGEQWIIRREAFRRVRDALQQQGITFAHREVRVRLPEELEHGHPAEPAAAVAGGPSATAVGGPDPQREKLVEQATAAATTAVIAAELARQQKLDGAEEGDGEEM
ncbi:mechanosensitive ion channel family protein [Aestuariirhabdus litorea]|uniref:Mechanosensitive ion channel family protein n=1 Tax=Aestuariirhabdus litorea TaxID=2528527 RepID=A0A3P3VKT4_9GAMM|nr:mechanosensitive ion channel domain-containing protein [Aestuariirhabdus litorea]RRJ83300.1 mechanosensitive ion channel family protein [Aestuariirhabdus litorea]RWW93460.1 mechanosensitive ion channel [Endozoicomonadaceae bacterium GTF-13]